jgi:hypothetical protein
MITDEAEIAEQQRRAAEYQRATEEFNLEMAEQRATAERALAEFDRAKAAHEEALRQYNAKMAKPKSEFASQ